MTLDPASPVVKLQRFGKDAPPHMRQHFAKSLIRALDELGIKPGDEFVVAPVVVQPSLEQSGE